MLTGEDKRLLVIAGPCSVDDEEPVVVFCRRLAKLAQEVENRIILLPRLCFDKVRTISRPVDWPGMIMDPTFALDGTSDFNAGIRKARRIALLVAELGLPIATEVLDKDLVQYFDELFTLIWIGARTVQVPELRRYAGGVSMVVGFKNGLDGDITHALDGMESAGYPNWLTGPDAETGRKATFTSSGNKNTFLILRGGSNGPNYDRAHLDRARVELAARGLRDYILVDCSHGNSRKNHEMQPLVFHDVLQQRLAGLPVGMMLEAYLVPGRQDVLDKQGRRTEFVAGKSRTDACIGWTTLEGMVRSAYEELGR